MNTTDTAATCRVVAKPSASKRGVRNTPPPTPVSPAASPRPAPMAASSGTESRRLADASSCARPAAAPDPSTSRTIRTAEQASTRPSSPSNTAVGRAIAPPTAAAGTLAIASGTSRSRRTWPARANCTVPIAATTRLSTSAVGRITSGARPSNPITAM